MLNRDKENYAEAIQLLLTHLPTAYLGDATRDEANAMQIGNSIYCS